MASSLKDTAIKDGFYVDPITKITFYIKNGIIPPWVESKPWEWYKLPREKTK